VVVVIMVVVVLWVVMQWARATMLMAVVPEFGFV
jgi:hypothetical protein